MPSNFTRKAYRKRQTRLTFDPLDRSSSPTTGTMSPARVRYELDGARRTPASSRQDAADPFESDDVLSSSKKDDFNSARGNKNGTLPFKALPTPAKSSQIQVKDESDSLEVDHDPKPSSTTRQTRSTARFMPTVGKKKQRSLGFDGAYSSDESETEPNITPSKKNKQATKTTLVNLVSSSDEETPLATPTRNSNKKASAGRATRSSDPKTKSRRQKSITLSDSDDDAPIPAKRGKNTPILPRLRTGSKRVVDVDSDDEDPIISSPKRSQKPTYQVKKTDEEEDEDEDVKPTPIRRRARQAFVNDEDDEPVVSPLKRNRSNFKPESSSDSDVSPTKRRRRSTQQNAQSDSDDLPSLSQISRGRSRASESDTPQRTTRQQKGKKKHRTEREKTMELLKRKRNGENIEELTDSGSDSDALEEEDDFEQLEEFDDEEDEEEHPVRKPSKGKQKKKAEEDIDSDNFITDDEDEDGNIGIPGYASIPVQFTQQAHKPLKEHFRDVVEWLVHNKLNPHFQKDDEIYRLAFLKIDSECTGLAKSKFASTQWTAEFTRAVYARPVLEEHSLEANEGWDIQSGQPKCDACNHRKHQPSCALVFTGKAYDKKTLEELDQGRSSDDSEEAEGASDDSDSDDNRSLNSKGVELPSIDKRFACGPVCKVNAEQTHILVHWKWNLNQWVLQSLETEGELTPAKLAERDAMSLIKRTKYANKVVDRWEHSDQIKSLWRDYKSQVDTARNLIAKGKGGWQ